MTRINVGIPPKDLSNRHLLAEHREIKRIPNMIKQGKLKGQVPDKFCLGTGHVLFFANKLGYLFVRYVQIHLECKRRGFNVSYFASAWDGVPGQYMNNLEPTAEDIELVKNRINERLKSG